jgi:hypothetical protein
VDSGLIFPIIVALWLAYVVPQWIRRRERLSASGGTDRFSTAMRVLARRDERKQLERRPSGPAYVLTPPRRDLGVVVVRRARPVDLAPTRPLAPSRLPAPTPTPSRDHAELPGRRATVALAVLMLVSLVSTPALAGLAAFGMVPVAAPVLALLAAAATLALLRRRARRRAARRSTQGDTGHGGGEHLRLGADVGAVVPTPRAPERSETAAGTTSGRDAEDGTWTPVPVPPPTYLLKHAAPRPAAALTEPVVEPVRHVLPDLDLVLERRRASGE